MAEVNVRSLVRNTLYVNAGQFWQIGSRLVLTPIILTKIGLEGYGTWALLFGLSSYVTVINTSFVMAYSKLTAEFERKGEYGELGAALGSGMATIGSLGAVGLMGLVVLAPYVLPWLGVPESILTDASEAFLFVAIAVALDMSLGAALQVLEGLQRIDLRTRLKISASILDFVVAVTLLQAELGLVALAIGYLAGRLLAIGGAWTVVRRICPEISFTSLRVSREGLRTVMSLGARFQALALLNKLVGQGIRMLMSALCGVELLGAFHLAGRLLGFARMPASSVISPLLPAFAHLEAGADARRWETLFFRASKVLTVAAVIGLGFTAAFADSLLFAWTGQQVPEAIFAVRVMAVASFLTLLTGVGTAALRAAGTVRLEFSYGVVGATFSLLGLGLGYWVAAFPGIVVGMAAARVFGVGWFLWGLSQARELALGRYLGSTVFFPAAMLLPPILAVKLISSGLPLLALSSSNRWIVLISLASVGAVCAAACASITWLWVLSADERISLRRLIPLSTRSTATSL